MLCSITHEASGPTPPQKTAPSRGALIRILLQLEAILELVEHLILAMGELLGLAALTTCRTKIAILARTVSEAINIFLQLLVFPGQLLGYDDEFLIGNR